MYKIKNIIINPIEYIFRSIYLLYRNFSYLIYKLILKDFGSKSFIHPFASLRNHRMISIGNNVIINRNVNIWGSEFNIGNNVQINPNTCIYGNVDIGNNVMIAPNCMIVSGNHGMTDNDVPMIMQKSTSKGKIAIEDNVWIGANSIILNGIKLHSGCVVGAGSVVTKDVPSKAIVVGNPAKVVKYRGV